MATLLQLETLDTEDKQLVRDNAQRSVSDLQGRLCGQRADTGMAMQEEHERQQEAESVDGQSSSRVHPACHVITFNVGKKHNIGTIARCCTAFNMASLCLVGSRQFSTFGSHGADAHVRLQHFATLEDCCRALRERQGCRIVGLEIMEGARPVHAEPFSGPTAFMLGNEGQGLSTRQKQLCDYFVYIAQYGAGTASLNVAVACSIVLHRFAVWAGYPERQREGEKFVVGERPTRDGARGSWLASVRDQLADECMKLGDFAQLQLIRVPSAGVVPLTVEEKQELRDSRQQRCTEVDEEEAAERLASLLE